MARLFVSRDVWLKDETVTDLRPDHEGVHRSFDVVGSGGFLALRRVRVRRC